MNLGMWERGTTFRVCVGGTIGEISCLKAGHIYTWGIEMSRTICLTTNNNSWYLLSINSWFSWGLWVIGELRLTCLARFHLAMNDMLKSLKPVWKAVRGNIIKSVVEKNSTAGWAKRLLQSYRWVEIQHIKVEVSNEDEDKQCGLSGCKI